MKPIRVRINGLDIEASPGRTILDVVHEHRIDEIPTLCHSPELEPYGSCFVCVVEVKGRPNLVPACATLCTDGMEIETDNERVHASRKTALELLLSNHYADCLSPCMEGCPAGVDAQGYIALAAMGQYRKAVDLIREANPLPAVCGRVCVRKCEVVCRRTDVDAPVGINAIKRFVTDTPGIYDGAPSCDPPTGKSVGIVGGGPAGLTAAYFLGRKGHAAVIYEAQPRSGGMLRYGIPVYRLPDEVIDDEIAYIRKAGVEIHNEVVVGRDVSLEELMRRHDAVFLGTGAWAGKPMRVEGEFDTAGIVTGVDFLRRMNETPEELNGTVVVVGGGNTAMDVARTSWRLGADKVILLYRRTKDEMPADEMEIAECLEEGIEIMELAAPVGIVADRGRLKALRCQRMKLGEPDDSGRRRPIPLDGSEFDLPCQLAVSAIGQAPVTEGITAIGAETLELTRWNTIVVEPDTMRTNIAGLYAGGDSADEGPTVVIDAIRDGQRAARAIHAYVSATEMPKEAFAVRKRFWSKPGRVELGEVKESPRHEIHMIDVERRRSSFAEVATGFEHEDVVHECDRCLSCGCVRFFDCDLRRYAEAYGVDMDRFKGYVRKHKVDDRHPYLEYDPNKCILCTRCIRTCARVLPIAALGLVGRGVKTEMRPAMNDPLFDTSCINCGNCVDACPTGALTVKYPFSGRAALITEDEPTHCGFCSLGCAITVKKFGADRYYIGPSGTPGAYLCRHGRFGHELFVKRRRIGRAEIRSVDTRRYVDLCDAEQAIVSGMRRVAELHGPEAVGVFVSPDLTNEELYIAGRIAREGLGTRNVASLSVLGSGRDADALDASFGYTASTADRSCIAQADLIICNNTALESEHLPLASAVISRVRAGARLVVSNSSLEASDQHLSALALDPLRGTAAVFWNGVTQMLIDDGHLEAADIGHIDGGPEFLARRAYDAASVSTVTGIEIDAIRAAADELRSAKHVVFIHNPDRLQDQSPGDIETIANLIVLLRAAGAEAELLLPRAAANGAALAIVGADPAFGPGRVRLPGDLAGAVGGNELRDLLASGGIRAAFIIGEDPLAWDRTGVWFQNIEFLAAMDWGITETIRFADVVLPGSTYLESAGTRCAFDGTVVSFNRVIEPPAGVSGDEVLRGLAGEFGVSIAENVGDELRRCLQSTLGPASCFYWNMGEARVSARPPCLVPVESDARATSIQPPLTHGERYKRMIREVGIERFRVVE
jgi:formate dehydrogenase major subunit